MVKGITVVTDLELVKKMHRDLWRFTNSDGAIDLFPVPWSFSLHTINLKCLTWEPYVAAPKPEGTRYLLYADLAGDVYLENQTLNFFLVDKDRAIKLLSHDRSVLKDTVLDGFFVRPIVCQSIADRDPDARGRLTFVIQDAIRCNGTDLTKLCIVDRVAFIEVSIFKLIILL